MSQLRIQQRGNFVLGLVVGLLVGLSLALGVALYITKAPVPFVNKVPPRTAEQDKAETERNRDWDPNAPLSGRGHAKPVPAVAAASAVPAPASGAKSGRDPAAILAGGAASAPATVRSTAPGVDPFMYFVQVGAYASADDAEQQRAKLALTGLTAKISEREQSGRTMYRVRLGPYSNKDEAESAQQRLTEQNIDARLVRVERN